MYVQKIRGNAGSSLGVHPPANFIDVCCEPLLLKLNWNDMKSLCATSSQLRDIVHRAVPALSIGIQADPGIIDDLSLLAQDNWSSLQTLKVKQALDLQAVLDLKRSQLPNLLSLKIELLEWSQSKYWDYMDAFTELAMGD